MRMRNDGVFDKYLRELKICLLFCVILFALGCDFRKCAAASGVPGAVNHACAGVVCVRSVCRGGGEVLEYRDRTGFLAGSEGAEPYVVTTIKELVYSEADIERIRAEQGIGENVQITSALQIIFQGDVEVSASIIGSSEQKNIAILRLSQSLTDKYILSFPEKEAMKGDAVYLLSFPWGIQKSKDNFSGATVTVDFGVVQQIAREQVNDTHYFSHGIHEGQGALGGPLVTDKGYVVGLQVLEEGDLSLALSFPEITRILELHNLKYTSAGDGKLLKKSKLSVIAIVLAVAAVILLIVQLMGLKKMNSENGAPTEVRQPQEFRGRIESAPQQIIKASLTSESGQVIPITVPQFMIGSADYQGGFTVFGNRKVSRRHAAIRFENGEYSIEDLHSTNGTLVNEQHVPAGSAVILKDGDEITLADERFTFREQ